jgi:hypothetical protein
MSIANATTGLHQLCSLYLFGQPDFPQAEETFDINNFYDKEELDELELHSFEPKDKPKNVLYHLNTDWDTFPGSMRNSTASILDAFFSSIGTGITGKLNFNSKLGITAGTFLSSLLANKIDIPFLSNKISMFNYAGRLMRAPLHVFDSTFSAIGESWSGSSLGNVLTLGLSALGLSNSLKNPKDFEEHNELDYQTINGTLARSSLHNLQSLTSSFAQNIYKLSPILGGAITLGLTGLNFALPESITKHHLSWKSINGVLSQNIFHFTDSLYAGLGSLISKGLSKSKIASVAFLPVVFGLSFSDKLKDIMSKKLVFTEFNAKGIRSAMHGLDTITFNLGTAFAKTPFALPFLGAYSLLSYSSALAKDSKLPKIPEFKIPLNKVGALIHRLPFDFVESVISETSNKLSQKIPSPILFLLGPAVSYKLGSLFKDAKTPFNTSTGLLLKHLIHFWDNLLTSSGYQTGKSLTNLVFTENDKPNSGSILSDGRWLTSEGRIVSKMALGKQLAS